MSDSIASMELIWDDLSTHSERLPSADWREGVLTEREIGISRAEDEFEDGEAVKKRFDQLIPCRWNFWFRLSSIFLTRQRPV